MKDCGPEGAQSLHLALEKNSSLSVAIHDKLNKKYPVKYTNRWRGSHIKLGHSSQCEPCRSSERGNHRGILFGLIN